MILEAKTKNKSELFEGEEGVRRVVIVKLVYTAPSRARSAKRYMISIIAYRLIVDAGDASSYSFCQLLSHWNLKFTLERFALARPWE